MNDIAAQERRRRGIYLLPNAFTTAALFAGFYAVVQAINGRFEVAARAATAASDLAGELGLERTQSEAATTLSRLKSYAGDPDAATEEMGAVIRRLRRSGYTTGLVRALHQMGGILF